MTNAGTMSGTATASPLQRREAPLVEFRDLRVHFRTRRGMVRAVDGVSFDLNDGETFGLVGETGSGKTVTARSMLRLVPTPPGVFAGGQVLYRPKMTCPACHGSGCSSCDNLGRRPQECDACAGAGCEHCGDTGRKTLDLLKVPITTLRQIRGNRIAMIFQDPSKALNPALSVRQQIAEVFYEHRSADLLARAGLDPEDTSGILQRAARNRRRKLDGVARRIPPLRGRAQALARAVDDAVAEALADTRIASPRKVMRSYPHELSGGMKQRVMIAQALACNPDLLIADEPTTALDVTIQARILDLIRDLQAEYRTAVLYISHDLSLVRKVCDRVGVLYAGQLAEVSPVKELFARPLHPYTRGLLAAIPRSTHGRGELEAIPGNVPELVDPPPQCRFNPRCPHAADVCTRVEPFRVSQSAGHDVACFGYESAASLGVSAEDMPVVEEAV